MEFTEIIQKVNTDKRLIPDLMKSEKGNNFRAVSESAILDVLEPIFEEAGLFYTIDVKKSDLQIREAYGPKGKKLQFIATVEIKLTFHNTRVYDGPYYLSTESVGMGIDDNDKAMGKAYTYAVKYALLKIFRLRYADDPDAKASEPLYLDKPKTEKSSEKDNKNENITEKSGHKPKSVQKSSTDKNMTEAQRDYILGMMEQKGIGSQIIMGQFDGYDPVEDDFIPMKTARAMIKWLEEQEKLPF